MRITTLRTSTMPAVEAAIRLLDDDGGLLIAVYPGHEEGTLEGQMLDGYFETLDRKKICVSKLKIVNSPTSPFFFLVEKR
ncbi:MAG: rRNA methyltransferase, partial [Firmicutes bacterium]|nr:rRNA methyltransferase [Candidatus Colimorpha enterica]